MQHNVKSIRGRAHITKSWIGEGSLQMITVLHGGGSSQMITVLHRGGPANDYGITWGLGRGLKTKS